MFETIVLPVLYGFAVFILGMKLMEMALHRIAGPRLTGLLERSTDTPLRGLAVGTVTTAFLQSSTAVTVISIGLVNAGLLTFPRTLGIVLGTNIGTCLTTELIGLNLGRLAMPLLAASLGLWLFTALACEVRLLPLTRADRPMPEWLRILRGASVVLAGFAMLIGGITIMQSIGPAVQASGLFGWFLERAAESLLWGVAAGMTLTAIVHSSAAVIGMTMGLAAIGALPPALGIAIVLGSNVGTCFTALLASVGGSRAGQLVAWSHVLLNVGGAALFLPFTGELAAVSGWMAAGPAGQIARAQTIFNIASSLLALPLCYLPALRRLTVR